MVSRLKHLVQVLAFSFTALAGAPAFACDTCPKSCIDIIPCPATEYVPPLVCDPKFEVFEIYGRFDYWTELMRHYKTCEITFDDFRFTLKHGFEPVASSSNSSVPYPKITVRAMQGDIAVTSGVIAGQPDVYNRVAIIRGCFASPTMFLAEQISFDAEEAAAGEAQARRRTK